MILVNTIKQKLAGNGASANAFFSLVNKGINALVPLLFIPICNNIFGVEAFGLMIFYQSLVGLIITFSDYGFSITGLKAASLHANNHIAINKLFSEVSFIKITLLFIGGIVLFIYLTTFTHKLSSTNEWLLFLFVFGSLSLQSLLPYWLYQGLKKNKTVAVINLVSKLLLLLLTVLIVLKSKHIFSVALIELLSYLFALIISIYLLSKQFALKIKVPSANAIKHQLIGGFNFFIIILIYWAINGGSILVVEKNVSAFELGFYGIFLRFSYYLFAIFQPIILSFIPFFTEKFQSSFNDGVNYFKKTFFYYSLITLTTVTTLALFLNPILNLLFKKDILDYFQQNQLIPYTLLIWTFLLLINNFTANAILLASNKEKIFRNAQIANGITVVVLFFLLIPVYGSVGAGISMLCGELIFSLLIFNNTYKFLFQKLNTSHG